MSEHTDLAQAYVAHLELTLERLNERIARLAHWLGVSLEDEEVRQQILMGHLHLVPDWHHIGSDRRREHELEELRGLMVLRARMMSDTLQALGLENTYQLAQMVREQMTQEGFAPGSDGFEMLKKLQAAHDDQVRR